VPQAIMHTIVGTGTNKTISKNGTN